MYHIVWLPRTTYRAEAVGRSRRPQRSALARNDVPDMIFRLPLLRSHPSHTVLHDSDLVTEARAVLGLLEFDFFRAAWRHWHGEEPDDRALEPAFVTYLFQQRVPGYVRHFARRVLEEAAGGRLDPAALRLDQTVHNAAVNDLQSPFAVAGLACLLLVCIVVTL